MIRTLSAQDQPHLTRIALGGATSFSRRPIPSRRSFSFSPIHHTPIHFPKTTRGLPLLLLLLCNPERPNMSAITTTPSL
jgi:hypothetical protein